MGEALPVVLVPGLNCSARLYGPQVNALWPLAPIMIANHRRDSEVATLAARTLSEAPPRFAIVGLSMGGYAALEMIRQAPDRIGKLALLDTMARQDTPETTAVHEAEIAMARSGRFGELADLLIPRMSADHQSDEGLKTLVRQMAAETGAEAFVRQERVVMSRPDFGPLLPSIRCPTLVLVGEADARTPPELARELAAGIAGARLVVVPKCGHLSTIEQPETVNAALLEWLQS
jgi:pimeloyl-ACP methyl ester carboxylesterase